MKTCTKYSFSDGRSRHGKIDSELFWYSRIIGVDDSMTGRVYFHVLVNIIQVVLPSVEHYQHVCNTEHNISNVTKNMAKVQDRTHTIQTLKVEIANIKVTYICCVLKNYLIFF